MQQIWVQAYTNAWHVPWSTSNSLYTFSTAEGGHECPLLVTRRRLGEHVAVNTHTIGTSFVGKVRNVRQKAEAQIGEGVAGMVEFKAQVNGHEATEKANRIQAWHSFLN